MKKTIKRILKEENNSKNPFGWTKDIEERTPFKEFQNQLDHNIYYSEELFELAIKGIKTVEDIDDFASYLNSTMQDIWDDARTEGYDDGYSEAQYEYEDRWQEGYDEGREEGWDDGYEEGRNNCDCDDECSEKWDDGYETGHNDGHSEGHSQGYEEGQNECEECD